MRIKEKKVGQHFQYRKRILKVLQYNMIQKLGLDGIMESEMENV